MPMNLFDVLRERDQDYILLGRNSVFLPFAHRGYTDPINKVKTWFSRDSVSVDIQIIDLGYCEGFVISAPNPSFKSEAPPSHLLEQIEGVIHFLSVEKIRTDGTPGLVNNYYRATRVLNDLIHYRDELVATHFDHVNK